MPCKKPPLAGTLLGGQERAHLENLPAEALDESFPANDTVAVQFEARMPPDSSVDLSDALIRSILSTRSEATIAADKGGSSASGILALNGFSDSAAPRRPANPLDTIIPERLRQRHWERYDQAMKTGRTRYGEGDTLAVPAVRKGFRDFNRVHGRAAAGSKRAAYGNCRDSSRCNQAVRTDSSTQTTT